MATLDNERPSAESRIFDQVRGQGVWYGAYFVALIYLGSAAILYVQSWDVWFMAAHGRVMAVTGLLALSLNLPNLEKFLPFLANRHDHRNSTSRLFVLAMLTYAAFLYGYAVNPMHQDERPFILLAVVFAGICFSFRQFFVVYLAMLGSLLAVIIYAGKSLPTFDIVYIIVLTPILGALVCQLQTNHYKSLFLLRQSLEARELELNLAHYVAAQEQSKRLEAEERKREVDNELQRQNEHLQHVSRVNAMGEMVAGIAHEINQPLNAISLHSGVLRHPNTDEDSRVQAIVEIEKLSSRCAGIIRRLQGFVRVSSAEKSPVNMSRIVDDSIALTASLAKQHEIDVLHDPQNDNSTVIADEVQIQQVLVNLLRNAFDAMKPHIAGRNKVTVSTEDFDSFLRVSVKDQGCGLEVDTLQDLFEPFFTTKSEGMGMGLAISRSIVERYGGSLEAQANDDYGMTFSFTLRKEHVLA